MPLLAKAESEAVGARAEMLRVWRTLALSGYLPIAGFEKAAVMAHTFLDHGWGPKRSKLMSVVSIYAFQSA